MRRRGLRRSPRERVGGLPRTPLDLGPSPIRIPGGLSATAARPRRSVGRSTLVTLASSSERSRLRWNHVAAGTDPDRFLLSWPCPLPPLRRLSRRVHSRPARPPERSLVPSGRGFHAPTSRSARVVSHHLDGFLRCRPAGLLRPASGPGVRRVSARWFRSSSPRRRDLGATAAFPRRGPHPSKGSPRRQPYRIAAAVALLPSPPSTADDSFRDTPVARDVGSGSGSGGSRLQGLAPPTNPLSPPGRCRPGRARSSHGLVSPPRSFRAPLPPDARAPGGRGLPRGAGSSRSGARRRIAAGP
jgi:hypothetical protein